jgi:hypothetical protein
MTDKNHKLPMTCYDIDREIFIEIENVCTEVARDQIYYNDHEEVLYIFSQGVIVHYQKTYNDNDLPFFREISRNSLPVLAKKTIRIVKIFDDWLYFKE